MSIHDIIEQLAAQHATAKKVGKKHFLEFAQDLIDSMPKRKSGGGKPASESTLQLRSQIMNLEGNFTVKQIAESFDVDVVTVNRSINFLKSKGMKKIEHAGYGERAGSRGNLPVLWKFSK